MKCVILQPSYIPWRGYFHQINKADIFVFYDDVQYDSRGWRNRNKIKTSQGLQWLTIPVHSQGSQTEGIPINKIRIDQGQNWGELHLKSVVHAYKKAPYFEQYFPMIEPYFRHPTELLAEFTIPLTIALARHLGISHTRFMRSSELGAGGCKTERLLDILSIVKADHYISGPAAASYLDQEKFRESNITLEYMTYHYPQYPQLYPPFAPQVSILDLLFMTGPQALSTMDDGKEQEGREEKQ